MKTPTAKFERCICQHANVAHFSVLYVDHAGLSSACGFPDCVCQQYIRDWWLARIVYRRLITAFARQAVQHAP